MARTREFDIELATDRALQLFWSKGYEGTTLADLTETMGINRPSLYAAFGNKEGLFDRALERYLAGPGAGVLAALGEGSAREAVTRIWRFYADAAAIPGRPKGCLLVQGALVCSDESATIRQALTDKRHFGEAVLIERLERAKREGELPRDSKPTELAHYVWTVCYGLAVRAAGGASREEQRRVVQIALRAWPA